MEKILIKGDVYTVATKTECTITSANGTPLGKATAENPVSFTATTDRVELSDPDAEFARVNPKYAPAKLKLLRMLGGGAPKWLSRLEIDLNLLLDGASSKVYWINADKRLIIHTDRVDDSLYAAVADIAAVYMPADATLEQYNHNIEISWRDINKYAHCKTYTDMVAVNPEFANDLTSDGEWVYPLPEVTATGNRPGENWYTGWWAGSNLKKAVLTLPKCTSARCTFAQVKQELDLDLELPIATYIADLSFQTIKLRKLRLIAPEATTCARVFYWNLASQPDVYIYAPKAKTMHNLCDYVPHLEEVKGEFGAEATNLDAMYTNCPKLRVFPTYYPKASTAANMLHNCQIAGQQAIEVLNSIPAYTSGTHNITMGIHIDYQNDAEVLAAIDNATAKGWTVTTQWNGTATSGVSTFGFKRIWVRKTQDAEYGRYADDNGTRWSVEWCDMLSAPDGSTPEDHGYELFRSVEAAVAYWELAAYEQEEILTTITENEHE